MRVEKNNTSASRNAHQVLETLLNLQRFGQRVMLLSGLGWTIAGSLLLSIGFVFALGWWGGTLWRVLGWSVVVAGMVFLSFLTLLWPLKSLVNLEFVAKRIGQILPERASDILSASQLAGSWVSAPGRFPFSEALAARHFHLVGTQLTAVPPAQIFPLQRLIGPAVAFVLATAIAVGVYWFAPGVIETGLGSLWRDPQPPDSITRRMTARAPVVGDLTLTLRYPEYLFRPERRLDATSGGFSAPLGTTVVIEGRSLIPNAVNGVIELPDNERRPLTVESSGDVRGSFIVDKGGTFEFALGTEDLMVEGPSRKIDIQTDPPPLIRLLRPTGQVQIDEQAELSLDFDAEDDHGLSRIDLVLRAGTTLQVRKTVVRLADRVRRLKTSYRWSPESVNINDESEVQLELEAFDDDAILGPKPGRSEPLTVKIMTPVTRHLNALKEQSRTLDALVDLLAKRLEGASAKQRESDTVIKKRFTEVRRQTEDVLGKTARLIHTLNHDALAPPRIGQAFAKIREELSNQLLFEARLYEAPADNLRKRQSVNQVTVRMLERAIIRIDDLIIDQQFSKLVGTSDALEQFRSDIGELLGRFSRTRSESARRAVLDAIERMEEALRQLGMEIDTIRGKVQDIFLNPSAVMRVDLLGSLERLKALLAAGDLKAARQLVKRMETDLGRMMAGLESNLMSFRTERFGEGEQFIGDLLERVMRIEAQQLQLRRETIAVMRRYQERLVEVMRGRIDPLVKQQLHRVRRIRRTLGQLDKVKSKQHREQLVQLRVGVRELELALGQGDLDETQQIADEVVLLAESWHMDEGKRTPPPVREVTRLVGRLSSELSNAYPKPAQLLPEKDRRRIKSQSTKQRHVLFQTKKLRTWINRQGEETRFLATQALGTLRTVASRMADAVAELEEKQIRMALGDQSAALDSLARLREDLKRGGESTPLSSQPVVFRQRIEIPDPDDYQVPPEFREDILDAMRGELPTRYQEAIRQYYETLVH